MQLLHARFFFSMFAIYWLFKLMSKKLLKLKPLLVIIGGPTGVGKTKTAIDLAKQLGCEIISADSRQVFKEMSIGTAVPSEKELKEVKHHFIQSHSVLDQYNASRYEIEVIEKLKELYTQHPIAVMVGGSGLYIDAVCNGIDDLPSIPGDVRKKYENLYESKGLDYIVQLVKENDPTYAEKADLKNHKRLLKALEIYEITGKPYSTFLKNEPKKRFFDSLFIILDLPRNQLYDRINQRVDLMVEQGLEAEARAMEPYKGLPPLKTVGYREFFDYFEGKISKEEAIDQVKNHSRAYARRQLTWFRRYKGSHWFNPVDQNKIVEVINERMKLNGH